MTKKQIVITMDGGLIQNIDNIPEDVEIAVLDMDIDGMSLAELRKSPWGGDLCTINVWDGDGRETLDRADLSRIDFDECHECKKEFEIEKMTTDPFDEHRLCAGCAPLLADPKAKCCIRNSAGQYLQFQFPRMWMGPSSGWNYTNERAYLEEKLVSIKAQLCDETLFLEEV